MNSKSTGTMTGNLLDFRAVNVTGTKEYAFSVDPALMVDAVIEKVTEEMRLPDTSFYAFRDDGSSRYLDEKKSIGESIHPGARLTVTPRTHLG